MSAESVTVHKLRCDVCRTTTLALDGASIRELRQRAKAAGWRYVKAGYRDVPTAQDRCGRCSGGAP
jgi:hypothetical protein